MINRADYPHPVSELIDHGPIEVGAADFDSWFDYVGHYDLDEIDVPPLIDLMAERGRANAKHPYERDAPIHACRALAQLGDGVAERYFLYLIERSKKKMLVENARAALTVLGRAMLTRQTAYFDDPRIADSDRLDIAEEVWMLGQRFPQVRDLCVDFLTSALSRCEQYSYDLNGFLVLGLVKLKATEASELIENALTSGKANDEMNGS